MKFSSSLSCYPNRAAKVLRTRIMMAAHFCMYVLAASSSPGEYLGIRFDTSLTDLLAMFRERGILVERLDADTLSTPRTPAHLERVSGVRFYFTDAKLYKMVVFFEVPPHEPTAARLLTDYKPEQDRLSKLYGPPIEDTVSMDAPSAEDRYQWLQQARAYYRTVWGTRDKVTITLWLYGSDEGIVFSEIYEKSEAQ